MTTADALTVAIEGAARMYGRCNAKRNWSDANLYNSILDELVRVAHLSDEMDDAVIQATVIEHKQRGRAHATAPINA